ncbi:MAG TPA: hypothetical protein VNX68_10900 [Nitrosopumilaceae archaeon]|jgi:hypothetical protein|nr:hypothetical protein [Nitrosopumilaceae archaeon]
MIFDPTKTTVVKIERVLYPTGQPAKIYDQAKTCVIEMLLDDAIREQMGGEKIGYFQALRTQQGWQIGRRVPNKTW